jgi:hypothetical protein
MARNKRYPAGATVQKWKSEKRMKFDQSVVKVKRSQTTKRQTNRTPMQFFVNPHEKCLRNPTHPHLEW